MSVTKFQFEPLHDYVIVERDEEDEITVGGTLIPPSASKERSTFGTVLAVGEGKRLKDGTLLPPKLKVGDRVAFGKYAGTEIELPGKAMGEKKRLVLVLKGEDIPIKEVA